MTIAIGAHTPIADTGILVIAVPGFSGTDQSVRLLWRATLSLGDVDNIAGIVRDDTEATSIASCT